MDGRTADDELLILGRSAIDEIIELDEHRRPIRQQPLSVSIPELSYARRRDDPASLAGIWRAIGEL